MAVGELVWFLQWRDKVDESSCYFSFTRSSFKFFLQLKTVVTGFGLRLVVLVPSMTRKDSLILCYSSFTRSIFPFFFQVKTVVIGFGLSLVVVIPLITRKDWLCYSSFNRSIFTFFLQLKTVVGYPYMSLRSSSNIIVKKSVTVFRGDG